ncbi:MAG: hypothetical protein ACPG31_05900 [Planctomycetota bacterium]
MFCDGCARSGRHEGPGGARGTAYDNQADALRRHILHTVMLVIYRRWGLMVPLVFAFAAFGIVLLESAVTDRVEGERGWGLGPVLLLSALILWPLGRRMNADNKKVVLDTEAGEEIRIDRSHSFFFLNVEWWALPAILLAVYAFVSQPTPVVEPEPETAEEFESIIDLEGLGPYGSELDEEGS